MESPGPYEISQAIMTFQGLIQMAEDFLKKKKFSQAVAALQIAAFCAAYNHHGEFVSKKIERILRTIGKETSEAIVPLSSGKRNQRKIKNILHVLTAAKNVGGDTRFVWRWILRDSERSHSVALTRQMYHELPQELLRAVASTGGSVHVLDCKHANVIKQAKALRRISKNADAVFLDIYPEDVVPVLAFANKFNLPPIIFVNQADHQFWIGASISDMFVHMRDAGMWLSENRRGILIKKMMRLPIPLELRFPKMSRSEARKKIGISEDKVVLLSIARAVKYSPVDPPSFAEAAVSVLNKHKNAVLLVIGPSNSDQWKIGYDRTQGRIRALGQLYDTLPFYLSADIYLDSFPFSSNTSLLEAGSFALPLVSYFPYSKKSEVLGPGAPGIEKSLIRVRNVNDYQQKISRLILNKELRLKIGNRTKRDIISMHMGDGWNCFLQELYDKILTINSMTEWWNWKDKNLVEELDLLLNRFYHDPVLFSSAVSKYARDLPYFQRLQFLFKLLRFSRSFSFSMFLPNTIGGWFGRHLKGWRRGVPIINRWLST